MTDQATIDRLSTGSLADPKNLGGDETLAVLEVIRATVHLPRIGTQASMPNPARPSGRRTSRTTPQS